MNATDALIVQNIGIYHKEHIIFSTADTKLSLVERELPLLKRYKWNKGIEVETVDTYIYQHNWSSYFKLSIQNLHTLQTLEKNEKKISKMSEGVPQA